MRCVINDIAAFKQCFKGLGVLCDSIDFICETDGIRLEILDKSHITFVKATFKESFFTEYENDKPEIYSVDADEFEKVLKKVKGDELVLEFDESLTITNGGKRFVLYLMDVEYNAHPGMPNIPYAYNVDIPYGFLKESLADCGMYSIQTVITTKDNVLTFNADGTLGEYSNSYETTKDLEPCRTKFSIEKLKIMQTDKISEYVNIKTGNDLPILLTAMNLSEDLTMQMMIAPWVDKEE